MESAKKDMHVWMQNFQYGAVIFFPKGELYRVGNSLRSHFDPRSAETCSAHITITQPLKSAPSDEDLELIKQIVRGTPSFEIVVGPAVTSPNGQLLWLDVNPKETIIALRDALHETGLFRTDLPLTKGFIPHMTLSESRREPAEVDAIIKELNEVEQTWTVDFDLVAWSIPDEDFVFREYRSFRLGPSS